MTKRELFVKAHEMTREIVKETGVNYRVQFGICLSFLYEIKKEGMKMTIEEVIKKVEAIDFDYKGDTRVRAYRWKKHGYDRLYVNHIDRKRRYTYGYFEVSNNKVVSFVKIIDKFNRWSAGVAREIQEACESFIK
mgnify:CR=1 FL=1